LNDPSPSTAISPVTRRSSGGPAPSPIPVTVCPAALLGVPPRHEAAVRQFVDHVRAAMRIEPIVTYDVRRSLLRRADRLGIERFHANLVIAAISHESATPPLAAAVPARSFTVLMVLTILATQTAIALAAILSWASL